MGYKFLNEDKFLERTEYRFSRSMQICIIREMISQFPLSKETYARLVLVEGVNVKDISKIGGFSEHGIAEFSIRNNYDLLGYGKRLYELYSCFGYSGVRSVAAITGLHEERIAVWEERYRNFTDNFDEYIENDGFLSNKFIFGK
ncbi:TPA: hypothetical protein I0F61_RS07915 [Enterococcus faecalis]|uniref:hypothetical protein n=1 Tax=Enterococcus faecalis TaxID=1351 RepID=UPI000A356644|nr:hypothetical protein [Enterococcus faecalis]OTP32897.1 hypothetical protein A5824_002197 [Enterococcus faecalis]HBI1694040.1 hypothetical protein [Enterococcus faecalis]